MSCIVVIFIQIHNCEPDYNSCKAFPNTANYTYNNKIYNIYNLFLY